MDTIEEISRNIAKFSLRVFASARKWFSVPYRFWASAFFAVFLFSLISYAAYPGKLVKIVLYFPSLVDGSIVAETRYVPSRQRGEAYAELLAKEIALGPITLFLAPVIPKGVEVRKVILREGSLYLDFGSAAAFREGLPLDIRSNLELVKKSILRNFPSLGEIVITIGGYQAFADGLEEKSEIP